MVDTEYRGRNALVRLDGDELLFSQGGRIARAVAGPSDWRIPIACIREVVFKDAKFASGLLHLVIGDAEIPKESVWALTGKQWTIEFQAGKQAKQMRDLRDVLEGHIARSRELGIDPSKARGPYVDTAGTEQLDEWKQRALGDTLVDASNSAADAVLLAKQSPAYSPFHPDLDSLSSALRADESIRLLAQGMSGLTPVLIALTDQRVLVHANSATAKIRESVPLPAHASWHSSLLSSVLTVRSGPHEVKVGALGDSVADRFLDALS